MPHQFEKISKEFEKRISYYTIASSLTNIWFSTLCNKKISKQEHEAGFWIGVLTPTQDDLTDNPNMDFSRIKSITEKFDVEPQNTIEYLAKLSATKLLSVVANISFYYEWMQKTQIAQHNSRIQFDSSISREDLKKIEFEKGSASTLMYRSLISSDLKQHEVEMIAELGFLLQFLNDTFDVYKDSKQHIYTIANTVENIETLKLELDQIIANFVSKLRLVSHNKKQKEKFLTHIFLVAALGYVCLEQYKKLQNNGKFRLKEYTRKQLICDMEKPINMYKHAKYTYKLMRNVVL